MTGLRFPPLSNRRSEYARMSNSSCHLRAGETLTCVGVADMTATLTCFRLPNTYFRGGEHRELRSGWTYGLISVLTLIGLVPVVNLRNQAA